MKQGCFRLRGRIRRGIGLVRDESDGHGLGSYIERHEHIE